MHTVIILSKHSSDLLKDYRFLFKPFIGSGKICFCDWNESGDGSRVIRSRPVQDDQGLPEVAGCRRGYRACIRAARRSGAG